MNQLPDLSQQVGFWKRLQMFVADVETNDMAGFEEKEVILYVCCRKIEEFNAKEEWATTLTKMSHKRDNISNEMTESPTIKRTNAA